MQGPTVISNDIMRNSDVFMRFSSSDEELIEAKIPEAEETINNESKNSRCPTRTTF